MLAINMSNLNQFLGAVSDTLGIITVICIATQIVVNYKFGIKFEKKFAIPKEYYRFSFQSLLIDTAEYVLGYFAVFLLIYSINIKWLYSSSKWWLDMLAINSQLFFGFSIYIFAVTEIINKNSKSRSHKSNLCFIILHLLLPLALAIIYYLAGDDLKIAMVAIMLFISLICTAKYVKTYIDFENYKYEIVEIEYKYYATFFFNDKFLLIEVLKEGDAFRIKERGKYVFKDEVSKAVVYRSKIK